MQVVTRKNSFVTFRSMKFLRCTTGTIEGKRTLRKNVINVYFYSL